jgi:hypothetical protein
VATTLKIEPVTPRCPMSLELVNSYGARLAAAKRGASTTPNGRLVSVGSTQHQNARCQSAPLVGEASLRAPPRGALERTPGQPIFMGGQQWVQPFTRVAYTRRVQTCKSEAVDWWEGVTLKALHGDRVARTHADPSEPLGRTE